MPPLDKHSDNDAEIANLEKRLAALKSTKKTPILPIAIIVGSIIVALSIFSAGTQPTPSGVTTKDNTSPQQQFALFGGTPENVPPINNEDHIQGDILAPITIIEYSDFECPFCKSLHPTLEKVMETYKNDRTVSWVYRHFPLDEIHTKARIEAAAAELAGELGGNDMFWEYAQTIFEITPSNDDLDLNVLVTIAKDLGLNTQPFKNLVEKDDRTGAPYAEHIEANYRGAVMAGGAGTPYTLIVAPNGTVFPLTGAQTYATIVSLIEAARKEI